MEDDDYYGFDAYLAEHGHEAGTACTATCLQVRSAERKLFSRYVDEKLAQERARNSSEEVSVRDELL
jgi:hypothetical protein